MTNTDSGITPDQAETPEVDAPTDQGDSARPAPAPAGDEVDASPSIEASGEGAGEGDDGASGPRRRRRGSRGGKSRNRPQADGSEGDEADDDEDESSAEDESSSDDRASRSEREAAAAAPLDTRNPELPDKHRENKPSVTAAEAALVRRPQIGDTRPAPAVEADQAPSSGSGSTVDASGDAPKRKRRRGGRGRGGSSTGAASQGSGESSATATAGDGPARSDGPGRGSGSGGRTQADGSAKRPARTQAGEGGGRRGSRGKGSGSSGGANQPGPVTAVTDDDPVDLDEKTMRKRRGKERKGRPVGRYLMAVHVQPEATQIAVLEGRSLIEHYVSRPTDGISQIHGNIYLGKVQNVLPGMEAAFVDIGTPKNAVLYRGDTRYDPEDLDNKGQDLRIEQILRPRQTILCQVTKNPIGAKGARLTQEVSMPGRFVVLVPNSTTYGISKRLPDNERKRLRTILDRVRPKGHGLIVRTAAEGISAEELERDVQRLASQWDQIEAMAAKSQAPALLYQEPDMAVRVIREEFSQDYRQVVIDDDKMFEEVRDYVRSISPALVERVERYDAEVHGLPLFETHHVHEQLHKALDRKVWLPSGGSLIIERTEALTVIDVNTGKNVGKSSLEETVFRNNLEAAEEVARQLRLRDIGGIIVIDFIDMEIRANRETVIATFRQALARDKTRTQVFDISELGLVEMTRKRIGEGLLESLSGPCPACEGRGMVFDSELIGE